MKLKEKRALQQCPATGACSRQSRRRRGCFSLLTLTIAAAALNDNAAGWVMTHRSHGVRRSVASSRLWDGSAGGFFSSSSPNDVVTNFTDSLNEQESEIIYGREPSLQIADRQKRKKCPTGRSSSTIVSAEVSSLGDIMNSGLDTPTTEAASLKKQQTLTETYGITHPLDRMALTANGNLQRLVASYYDAPVTVVVESCELRQTEPIVADGNNEACFTTGSSSSAPPQVWDRVVQLQVHGTTFCTATSVITVHDALCQSLVESRQVGLGQLFRYLNILPEFELQDAGVHPCFWREYSLQCSELSCQIHEEFRPGMWEITAASGE